MGIGLSAWDPIRDKWAGTAQLLINNIYYLVRMYCIKLIVFSSTKER